MQNLNLNEEPYFSITSDAFLRITFFQWNMYPAAFGLKLDWSICQLPGTEWTPSSTPTAVSSSSLLLGWEKQAGSAAFCFAFMHQHWNKMWEARGRTHINEQISPTQAGDPADGRRLAWRLYEAAFLGNSFIKHFCHGCACGLSGLSIERMSFYT